MDLLARLKEKLSRADPRLLAAIESVVRRVPPVRERIERETTTLLAGLEPSLKPYRGVLPTHARLPPQGLPKDEILGHLETLGRHEEPRWREGFVSGAVYHGGDDHIGFLNQVYALTSQSNPLHSDLWPSANKMEAEVVAMTAGMLGAEVADTAAAGSARVCGTVTSGGTEGILLAVKTYRDWARSERGVQKPEMVVPTTAHAAFDKAADCFGLKLVKIPVGSDFRADVRAMRKAITRNTVMLAGSAPSFPHGVVDPIHELSEAARLHGAGFHTDACLGGFVLPWARRLGYPVPPFDFSLPGVTSITCDTHKFGFAAKGTSVVLYRNEALRRHQFFAYTEWPGGLYLSPTLAGSRPGALIAAAWAAMLTTGEQGYAEAARRVLETAARIKDGINKITGLRVLGDPLFVIAFASDDADVYRILDFMSERGWSLNGLHSPPALHICVTLRHTQPGVVERLLSDLREAAEHVRSHAPGPGGMAPAYGMAARLPLRGVVADLLKRYLDLVYRV